MSGRTIVGVVLPEGYTGASDFARDCGVEVVGICGEQVFRHASINRDSLAHLIASELLRVKPSIYAANCKELSDADRENIASHLAAAILLTTADTSQEEQE